MPGLWTVLPNSYIVNREQAHVVGRLGGTNHGKKGKSGGVSLSRRVPGDLVRDEPMGFAHVRGSHLNEQYLRGVTAPGPQSAFGPARKRSIPRCDRETRGFAGRPLTATQPPVIVGLIRS